MSPTPEKTSEKTFPSAPLAGQTRTLRTADGQSFQAWEVRPEPDKARGDGLIVLQEIFGLTDYIRQTCEMLAERGYHVIAPAIFDLVRPDIVLPYDESGITRGLAIRDELPAGGPQAEISACLQALRQDAPSLPVGVIGFCWGGLLAWEAAQFLPVNAASCWYGGGIADHCAPPPHCPTELQFGADDHYIPHSDWEKIRTACPKVEMFIYEGAGHGFGCTARSSYDPKAAALAWTRTLAFFERALGSTTPRL